MVEVLIKVGVLDQGLRESGIRLSRTSMRENDLAAGVEAMLRR